MKRLAKAQLKAGKSKTQEDVSNALHFRVDRFASLGKKLGLSGMDMAKLLGVSNQSVYHWDAGKSKSKSKFKFRPGHDGADLARRMEPRA